MINKRNEYNDDFFNQLEHLTAEGLLREYSGNRNETTYYKYHSSIQYAAPGTSSSFVDVSMLIKIPREQNVLYVPGVAQVLKFAWVQYFCVFLFWYFLLYKGLLSYLI